MSEVCVELVALRMNLYRKVALSFKKVGDPVLAYLCQWKFSIFCLEQLCPTCGPHAAQSKVLCGPV